MGSQEHGSESSSTSSDEMRRLNTLLENLETKRSEGTIGEAVYVKLRNEYSDKIRSLRPLSSRILGIDLGTSYAAAGVVMNGKPVMIPIIDALTEGGKGIASCVAIADHDEFLVGEAARRYAIRNPHRVFSSLKRSLGRKYKIAVDGREYTSQQMVALILGRLKHAAEDFLGEKVTKAVVAVPSCFSWIQEQCVVEAGSVAGLDVVRLIGESTAVSLTYGLNRGENEEKVMVIDFGSGKLDVAIVSLGGGIFQVLARSGDTEIGGADIDNAVVGYLVEEFRRQTGIDLSTDKIAMTRLKQAAEKAKIELSTLVTTDVDLPFVMQDKRLHVTLTRAKLEELALPILQRIVTPVKRVIGDAELTLTDIDRIVLAGGSGRMPIVQDLIRELLGHKPEGGVDPLEAVAMGAALQGAVLAGEMKDLLLLDVTPLSLGVETVGGIFTRVIERNTTTPTKRSQVFTTGADFQTTGTINVLQGERTMASDNVSLGIFNLTGISRAPRGVPRIEVTFDVDASGRLQVSAKDLDSGTFTSAEFPRDMKVQQVKEPLALLAETHTPVVVPVDSTRPRVAGTSLKRSQIPYAAAAILWTGIVIFIISQTGIHILPPISYYIWAFLFAGPMCLILMAYSSSQREERKKSAFKKCPKCDSWLSASETKCNACGTVVS